MGTADEPGELPGRPASDSGRERPPEDQVGAFSPDRSGRYTRAARQLPGA